MKINSDEQQYDHSNRDKAKEPRGRKHYCTCCDHSLVSNSKRCRVCRNRDPKKRYKKLTPQT